MLFLLTTLVNSFDYSFHKKNETYEVLSYPFQSYLKKTVIIKKSQEYYA